MIQNNSSKNPTFLQVDLAAPGVGQQPKPDQPDPDQLLQLAQAADHLAAYAAKVARLARELADKQSNYSLLNSYSRKQSRGQK